MKKLLILILLLIPFIVHATDYKLSELTAISSAGKVISCVILILTSGSDRMTGMKNLEVKARRSGGNNG